MSLPLKLTSQHTSEPNCVRNAFVRMAGSEEIIMSTAAADNELVNDVSDIRSIPPNNADENHPVPNKLLN